jgi:hypothetical protein
MPEKRREAVHPASGKRREKGRRYGLRAGIGLTRKIFLQQEQVLGYSRAFVDR